MSRQPKSAQRELAGWAHDLGKPLQVISAHGRALAKENGLSGKTLALAREIVALSDDALRVVDRLMESARPLGAEMNASDQLASTLSRVVAIARGLHPRCQLAIEGSVPPREVDSAGHLLSVLVNLVDNAIWASPDDQPVRISVEARREGLVIKVVDDGVGMSSVVREGAFRPYFSTRQCNRAKGLGLYECRRLLASCGGRIEIESSEGHGTCASVILPWPMVQSGSTLRIDEEL